jgi:hypothetical protein
MLQKKDTPDIHYITDRDRARSSRIRSSRGDRIDDAIRRHPSVVTLADVLPLDHYRGNGDQELPPAVENGQPLLRTSLFRATH